MSDERSLLDGTRTSFEWHEASVSVCVLPVGAFEQHSRHLPLISDSFQAEYFGEFLARELDAGLLPVLSYGTSLEQTGFAGTVTLRPETLMQIIRDIAGELARQKVDQLAGVQRGEQVAGQAMTAVKLAEVGWLEVRCLQPDAGTIRVLLYDQAQQLKVAFQLLLMHEQHSVCDRFLRKGPAASGRS